MPEFKKDLTSGNVFKQLLGFSVPFLLANLLQALYSVVDMIVVGQYVGPIGVSSVQVGSQVMQLIINMVSGLGVGATVMIAQYQGAGKDDDQKKTIGTLFTVFFIISVAVTAIMMICAARHCSATSVLTAAATVFKKLQGRQLANIPRKGTL